MLFKKDKKKEKERTNKQKNLRNFIKVTNSCLTNFLKRHVKVPLFFFTIFTMGIIEITNTI